MPKSKNGPALFEVINKGDLAGPRPIGEREEATRKSAVTESASAFKTTLVSLARSIGGDGREKEPEPVSSRDDPGPPPLVAIDEGYIRLALNSRAAGVAAFVLLLAMTVAFAAGQWLGRQSGLADGHKEGRLSVQRAARDQIEQARRSEPVRGLFDGVGESPVRTGPAVLTAKRPVAAKQTVEKTPTAAAPVWIKGYTYVVVQVFRGNAREDAEKAREYLARHGIEAKIMGAADKGFRLIATKGFDRSDNTQHVLADRFIERIRALGQEYFKSGGRYELEGYFATLRSDSW